MTSRLPVRCSTNWAMKPLTLGAGQLWVHMYPWKKSVLMIYEMNHIWTAEMIWKWRNDRQAAEFLCDAVLVFATRPPSYDVCSISQLCRALFLLVSVKTLSNLAGLRGAPSSSVDGYLLTGPYSKWKILLKGLICYQITFFSAAVFIPVVRQSSEKQRRSLW